MIRLHPFRTFTGEVCMCGRHVRTLSINALLMSWAIGRARMVAR